MSLLANRYARALFDAAQSRDAIDAVAGDLETIARALAEPAVRAIVLEPFLLRCRQLLELFK